jgi:catechol 2,3-dioxygenase-like lactoylglutathione lyase family enzyme
VSSGPTLTLIVLRAADLEATRAFYLALGLPLAEERHGNGPLHYSADLGGTVLEIYPGRPGSAPDRGSGGATLHGFRVASLGAALAALEALGAPVVTPPRPSPWDLRAVVLDPDGRAVELSEPADR